MNTEQEQEIFSAYIEWIDRGDCREIMQYGRGIFLKAYNGERFRSTRVTSGEVQLSGHISSI